MTKQAARNAARGSDARAASRPPAVQSAKVFSPGSILLPLALAQFGNSYGTSAMNLAITDVTHDLDTSVTAVQASISLYTLMMAAGMIVGSKLADMWGRR